MRSRFAGREIQAGVGVRNLLRPGAFNQSYMKSNARRKTYNYLCILKMFPIKGMKVQTGSHQSSEQPPPEIQPESSLSRALH